MPDEADLRELNVSLSDDRARTTSSGSAANFSHLGRLLTEAPLVGRAAELQFLREQFDAVASGAGGRLVFLSGEPGAGKTRLAREIGAYAVEQGGLFLEGHYLRDGTAAYGPWVEALRTGLRTVPLCEQAALVGPYGPELIQAVPDLVEHLGPFPSPPALPAEELRRRLFDGLSGLVSALSWRGPLVLLVDDLQWAPGLSLLAHLARRLGESRALVIGTYREQEFKEQPALLRDWAELNRARLAVQLRLDPLTAVETGELVSHYFGAGPAQQLRAPVYRQTRGNAFFIEEVLRSLAETGVVRSTEAGWEVVNPSRVTIPESMKLAVEERVARLGETAQEVLRQAAVLGQEFSFPVLRALTSLADDDLFDVIERAVAARLLVDRSAAGEERYAFADDQMQEVLYSAITTPRRRRYHLRAGQVLEAVSGDRLEAHLEELARHFTEGNEPEKGADYAYRAGLKNDRLFNWARSLPLYRMALELWEQAGGHLKEQAAACEKVGDVIYKSSIDLPLLSRYLQQALALYEQVGNRRKIAILHYQIARNHLPGGILATTDLEKALEHLHRSRTILEEGPDSVSLGLVYAQLAQTYSLLLQWSECIAWAGRAVELGERRKRPVIVADACPPLGLGLVCTGEVAQGVTTLERGWRVATQHRLAFQTDYNRWVGMMVSCYLKTPRTGLALAARPPDHRSVNSVLLIPSYHAALYALTGDFEAASRVIKEAQDWLEGLGQAPYGFFPGELGLVLFRRGDWAQARELLEAGLEWAIGSHHQYSLAEAAHQLGDLHLETGDYERAGDYLRRSVELYRTAEDVLHQLDVLPCLARLSVRLGHLDDARAWLAEAQALLVGPEDWGGLPGGVDLAEGVLRAAEGRWTEADAAFRWAIEVNQSFGLPWDEAQVAYEWANARLEYGDLNADPTRWERAGDLLDRAAALWRPMGARPWVAQVEYAQAVLQLARGRTGPPQADRETAALLERVLDTAQELGMARLSERALALKAGPTDQRPPVEEGRRGPERYPDGLTPREVDVLRLIAAGRTTREIAAELVVSVPTVERHISNLYGKIGARGRADATAYALRQGFV